MTPAQVAEQIAAIEHTQHHHPTHIDIRTQLGEEPPEPVIAPADADWFADRAERREQKWRDGEC